MKSKAISPFTNEHKPNKSKKNQIIISSYNIALRIQKNTHKCLKRNSHYSKPKVRTKPQNIVKIEQKLLINKSNRFKTLSLSRKPMKNNIYSKINACNEWALMY